MKRFIDVAVFVAILGSAGMASANGPSVSFQVRGDSASGNTWNENECGFSVLDIQGTEKAVHERGGAPVDEKIVMANYWAYDWCKGVEYSGYAYGPNDSFDADMNAASVQITFDVYSYGWIMGETGEWTQEQLGGSTLVASVSWMGEGEVARGMNSGMARWGKNMIRYRQRGEYRGAELKVDATLDGAPLGFETAHGQIGSYHEGSIEIYGEY